ncbi:hypothetical protein [Rhizobium sp. N4311]|uniref:hypothetical protein n=1 Tax=Rhizobium sp. N4311 TaxID=1703972 RepID=UPI000B95DE27|nr:hypothetical protein [Rhizobium sp. N4311]OYD05786.1 hypothetical protein AMK08_CH103857 [Rhizobium sp. N4311]
MTAATDPLRLLLQILAEQAGDGVAELRLAVQRVIDGAEPSLDVALGLEPAAGQRRITAELEERDRLIRETATTFFPENSIRERSEIIAKGLERFRSGADWQRSRARKTCPYPQGLKANFWRILKAFDRNLSAERVRKVLGREAGLLTTQKTADDSFKQ